MAEWVWQHTPDDVEIGQCLEAGDHDELEEIAFVIDSFPHGSTGSLFDFSWISIAIGNGSISSIRWMIAKGVELNLRGPTWVPPLECCLERENADRYDILKLLIAAGADVNATGVHNWTPLHLAAVREDQKAMEILLDAGADRTKRTVIDNYATPSEEARIMGYPASADFTDSYQSE